MEEPKAYQPNYVPEPDGPPVLADADKARDLADLEDARRDAINRKGDGNSNTFAAAVLDGRAEDLEDKWHQEDEMAGLNENEKWYADLMKMMTEKNGEPVNIHAFIKKEGTDGRPYFILHPVSRNTTNEDELKAGFLGYMMIASLDGVFCLNLSNFSLRPGQSLEEIADEIDWNKLPQELKKVPAEKYGSVYNFPAPTWRNGGSGSFQTELVKLNIKDDQADRGGFIAAIKLSEKMGIEMEKNKKAPKNTPEELFENVF